MKVFVTGVGGQLGHDVMNELYKRGYEGIGSDCLHATLSRMPDGNVSLLVINNKTKPDTFTVEFGEDLGLVLERRLYDPATIVPDASARMLDPDMTVEAGTSLTDTLPGGGVAVYTTIR